MTTRSIDLTADLHAEDDDGRNWALLRDAIDPRAVVPGAVLVAGVDGFWSVVRIHHVDMDGQVHFDQLDDNDPIARRVLGQIARA